MFTTKKSPHVIAGLSAVALLIGAPAAFAGFAGKTLTVTSPTWDKNQAIGVAELGFTDERTVTASDAVTPDVQNFFTAGGGSSDVWNIDFTDHTVMFEFTPIYTRTLGDQVDYMYMMSTGFRISDTSDQLPPIVAVTVDSNFAPFGFDASLVRFDENNIWLSLEGSMCHFYGMGSMPSCTNPNSPTGYDNFIKLNVQFAGETPSLDKTKVDALFNWAEAQYVDLFPHAAESVEIFGYYARCYNNGVCVGAKDGRIHATGGSFGPGIIDVGGLEEFFSIAGI